MSKQRVVILGATGHTGGSVLDGLLEYGKFQIEALVRPTSTEKPDVKKIAERGVKIKVADITGPVDDLAPLLQGVDVVISTSDAVSQLSQKTLASAAKKAGVKRFVPCAFTTIIPPGGVMKMRDEKEEVYNHVKKLHLPYTIIDVGYWHQISFPTLPSGRIDHLSFLGPSSLFHAGGNTPNLLTDLRDIGRFVARIIDDDRTLNRYVFTWSEAISENQIFSMLEELSGEKIDKTHVSAEELEAQVAQAQASLAQDPEDPAKQLGLISMQYKYSKYVRGDNTPEYAKYLGYLDARELYPDFRPISFREFLQQLLDGKVGPLTGYEYVRKLTK